jgi:16S rRNA G966 N2-methylase RsmD
VAEEKRQELLRLFRKCGRRAARSTSTRQRTLIIEGDNLEVLKLLQKAYLGKVKMIYIDPPYNTGNDFISPQEGKVEGQKGKRGDEIAKPEPRTVLGEPGHQSRFVLAERRGSNAYAGGDE